MVVLLSKLEILVQSESAHINGVFEEWIIHRFAWGKKNQRFYEITYPHRCYGNSFRSGKESETKLNSKINWNWKANMKGIIVERRMKHVENMHRRSMKANNISHHAKSFSLHTPNAHTFTSFLILHTVIAFITL